ncbi:hypothetical protein LJK87_17270 [Paenibacillus sp. P25]|nr:hypothetical protein LJK87_17270 [Paenibacillus sp. P25]
MDIALKILKYVIMYAPAVLGFHTWLYAKNPKYYFLVVRIFSKWRDTNWSVSVDYVLKEKGEVYQKIEGVLKRRYKSDRYKRTVNMSNKKLYECGIFSLLVQDDFDTGEFSSKKFFVSISQLNVTFNSAEEKLRELRELFNELERDIRPESSGYNLDIYFKKVRNPFFGLMVQRLGKENIAHFECFFPVSAIVSKNNENDKNKHFLRVYKEKICINESSFDTLEETAKRALLFR